MAEGKKKSFLEWYESYQGKRITGMVYSVGAAVVIVGALFKILHWPGASVVLMIGMFTEAFLFTIGVFDKPHAEYNWAEVFPQLISLETGADPRTFGDYQSRQKPTLLGAGSTAVDSADGVSVDAGQLSEDDAKSLKEGIAALAKTATQLADLGQLAAGANNLTAKMQAASEGADKFAVATTSLADSYQKVLNGTQAIVNGTEGYQKGLEGVNAQLVAINSIYELQLKTVQAQTDKLAAASKEVEAVGEGMAQIKASTDEVLKMNEAYKAGSKLLANQIADLNKVYGNMLNALA